MLQITPILAALKRHKVGTLLIGLQIALTLAIVCNAMFIIHQRLTHLNRPTGIVENDLLTVRSEWTSASDAAVGALSRTDLQSLRQLPGVADVGMSYGYPLRGGGWNSSVNIKPDDPSETNISSRFFADDHVLPVLGAQLIAGRNFRPDEVRVENSKTVTTPSVVIISKTLADQVYPDGSALGKPIYLGGSAQPTTVIGIVRYISGFSTSSWADASYSSVLIEPALLTDKANAYLIRAQPGQLDALIKAAPAALFKTNRLRIIPDGEGEEAGVRTFAQVRAEAYKSDRGLAIMMVTICIVLLTITAAGIVGLTSFWVAQRRKQIGVRRALGATRNDILSYFLTENFLISVGGLVVGGLLAISLSQWLVTHFEMQRLSAVYLLLGAIVLLVLGQLATLAPALRASRVSPVEATRSV